MYNLVWQSVRWWPGTHGPQLTSMADKLFRIISETPMTCGVCYNFTSCASACAGTAACAGEQPAHGDLR